MERVSAGPNWTSFEAPDVILLFLQGEIALEDAETINRANQTFAKDLPYFFYLINMGGSATLSADVRKSVASALKDLPLCGTAIYNADFKTKVVAKLLLRFVNRNRADSPISYHPSEEAARAWVEGRRRELLKDL